MSIDIVPLPHALGAQVRCGDVRALDDASAAAIRQAFLDHLACSSAARSSTITN